MLRRTCIGKVERQLLPSKVGSRLGNNYLVVVMAIMMIMMMIVVALVVTMTAVVAMVTVMAILLIVMLAGGTQRAHTSKSRFFFASFAVAGSRSVTSF